MDAVLDPRRATRRRCEVVSRDRDLGGQLVDALLAGAAGGLEEVQTIARSPKTSCSALGGSIAAIVVQFGLATMPVRVVQRVGVDL